MLRQIVEFCTSEGTLYWLLLSSDLAIAFAYFAIPITMAIVLRHRKSDIPYPWLWILFVTFIVACGMTHVVHAWATVSRTDQLPMQVAIGLFTALASVGTALAFAFILPQIKHLPSPREQRDELRRLVAERTKEKDRLIREINHRIGNQLQILSSIVSIESRKATAQESQDILARLKTQLAGMAEKHVQMSEKDYLGKGVSDDDGTITPLSPIEVRTARRAAPA
jgi:hypothetical protein